MDMEVNDKLRGICDRYRLQLKQECKAVSAACAFRKGKSDPDKATLYYMVFASTSHSALNDMKTTMIQHVQEAKLYGELAFTDYYHHKGIKIAYGRKTSDKFEAEVIYDLFNGKTIRLGALKAAILEQTEFPYHAKALR
jgi:hypothetical protein